MASPSPASSNVNVAGFIRLPTANAQQHSRCCERRLILTPTEAFEQYGTPLAQARDKTLLECQALCTATMDCTFLSFNTRARHCVLCATCELRHSFDGQNFSSWGRSVPGAGTHYVRTAPTALPPTFLQHNYSVQLYGAPGRVEVSTLRLVWMSLLPTDAIEYVVGVGLCNGQPTMPESPFHITRDTVCSPESCVDGMPFGGAYVHTQCMHTYTWCIRVHAGVQPESRGRSLVASAQHARSFLLVGGGDTLQEPIGVPTKR